MRPSDFGAVRHQGGVSPAWPITYGELEPWYTEAERLYRVRGERGTDPTEGPASAPYAYGPVRPDQLVVVSCRSMPAATGWRASRVDVSWATRCGRRSAVGRASASVLVNVPIA